MLMKSNAITLTCVFNQNKEGPSIMQIGKILASTLKSQSVLAGNHCDIYYLNVKLVMLAKNLHQIMVLVQ